MTICIFCDLDPCDCDHQRQLEKDEPDAGTEAGFRAMLAALFVREEG